MWKFDDLRPFCRSGGPTHLAVRTKLTVITSSTYTDIIKAIIPIEKGRVSFFKITLEWLLK